MFFQICSRVSGSSIRLALLRASLRITFAPLRSARRMALLPRRSGSRRSLRSTTDRPCTSTLISIVRHPFRFKMPRPWPTVETHHRRSSRHRAVSDGTLVQPLRDVDLITHNPARQHILEPLRVVKHLADELLIPVAHALTHGRLRVSDPRRPNLGPIRFRQVHQPGSRTLGIVEVRQHCGAPQSLQIRQVADDDGVQVNVEQVAPDRGMKQVHLRPPPRPMLRHRNARDAININIRYALKSGNLLGKGANMFGLVLPTRPKHAHYTSHCTASRGVMRGKQVTSLSGDPFTTSIPAAFNCGTADANSAGRCSNDRGIPPSTRRSCRPSIPSSAILMGRMW